MTPETDKERDEALARVEIITPLKNNPVAEYFSSSNTPETDAKASPHIGFYSCATVPAEFARKLERERDEAREALEDYTASTVHSCNEGCKRPMCVLRRQRDEAREDARLLAERLTRLELDSSLALAKLERERNELKKALEAAK